MHLHYNMVTSNVNARSIEIILSSASPFFFPEFLPKQDMFTCMVLKIQHVLRQFFTFSFSTILANSFLGKFWRRGFKPWILDTTAAILVHSCCICWSNISHGLFEWLIGSGVSKSQHKDIYQGYLFKKKIGEGWGTEQWHRNRPICKLYANIQQVHDNTINLF